MGLGRPAGSIHLGRGHATPIVQAPCRERSSSDSRIVRHGRPNDLRFCGGALRAPPCRRTLPGIGGRFGPRRRRRPQHARVRPHSAYKRVPVRMHERINSKVSVEIGPTQMMRTRPLDPSELPNRGVVKPGEGRERHKQLLAIEQEPKTIRRHIRDFNARSGRSTQCGFYHGAPGQVGPRPNARRSS